MEIQSFIAAFDRWPEDGLVESSDGVNPDQAIGSMVSTRDGSLLSEGPLPLARLVAPKGLIVLLLSDASTIWGPSIF